MGQATCQSMCLTNGLEVRRGGVMVRCSMCAIGGQLKDEYADLLSERARTLAAQTIEELSVACASTDSAAAKAAALARRWQELLDDPTTAGPAGLFSAMITFLL